MSSAVKLWERPSKRTTVRLTPCVNFKDESKRSDVELLMSKHTFEQNNKENIAIYYIDPSDEKQSILSCRKAQGPRFKEQFIQSFCGTSAEELYREGISAKIAGCLRPWVSRDLGGKSFSNGLPILDCFFLAGFREDQNMGLFEHGG